ncbi:MAG: hypothetical protein ACXVIY_11315 [Mucilaginibacter sp.]
MKKILLVLFSAAVVFFGCKKDAGTTANLGASDMATINGELKGSWLFPTDHQQIVDNASGTALADNGYISAPSMQFDGGSGVTLYTNLQTKLKGTYQLSSKNGFIYLDVTYPNGNDITYQVLSITSQTLTLISTEPYVFYDGTAPEPAKVVSNIVLQKENSADVTGKLVKVFIAGNSTYSVSVYVTHTLKADTAVLLDTKQNIKGTYTFAFPTTSGDQLNVDVLGDPNQISFYGYYNGLPMSGDFSYGAQEFKTTKGWMVP